MESRDTQLGAQLRRYRTRRRVTQQTLAELSAVSVRTIRDIELGDCQRPRLATVRLIAGSLGLTPRERAGFEAAAGHTADSRELRRIFESEPAAPPAPLGALVGRHAELAVLPELLASGSQRLVTMTGLGGVGKSRLALEVASTLHRSCRFPVLWTSSDEPHPAGDDHPDQLSRLIRNVLDGLFVTSSDSPSDLSTVIGSRPTLLVLDGSDAAQVRRERIAGLLGQCAGLRVLVTSRTRLDVPGERTFPLAPLAVPEDDTPCGDGGPHDLARVASVQLLVSHARQIRPDFELTAANSRAVSALCRRMDGIPSALEAVASCFLVYQADELLGHVESDPFGFAGMPASRNGLPGLRGQLDRILRSLDRTETAFLHRVSTVDGCWSVPEAVEITGAAPATVAGLARRLLVRGVIRPVGDNRSRFRVLELVQYLRQSGGEQFGVPAEGAQHSGGVLGGHWNRPWEARAPV